MQKDRRSPSGEGARTLWKLLEPIHAVVYFAPEVTAAFADRGLKGFWRGYFAARSAPMGAVGPGAVTAAFYGFHPDFVARSVPEIWSVVSPQSALEARLDGVGRCFGRLGIDEADPRWAMAASALVDALHAAPVGGRPIFAANRGLEVPDAPLPALWHAATMYREYRGDGHVAALLTNDLDGLESTVLRLAVDGTPREVIEPHRGWTQQDWSEALDRLVKRGLIDRQHQATPAGLQMHRQVEELTDDLCAAAISSLGERFAVVLDAVAPLADVAATQVPYPNPMGVPRREV